MKPVPVGAKGTYSLVVKTEHLASQIDPSLADVMSTATMIWMMEMAAMDAMKNYYDPGESSVGMAVDVQHLAATPPGHRVTAEAECTKSEGKRLEFKVRACDEKEEIGTGVHRRAVVDSAKFRERIKSKAKS